MIPNEIINEHYFTIGNALVQANILSPAGENIWVVFTDSTATVETFGSSESPAEWKPEVTHAAHWGRAIGWDSQDTEEWGYRWNGLRGLRGIFEPVGRATGPIFTEECDAAQWAVDNGHCPELIDDAMDRLREALAEQEVD